MQEDSVNLSGMRSYNASICGGVDGSDRSWNEERGVGGSGAW